MADDEVRAAERAVAADLADEEARLRFFKAAKRAGWPPERFDYKVGAMQLEADRCPVCGGPLESGILHPRYSDAGPAPSMEEALRRALLVAWPKASARTIDRYATHALVRRLTCPEATPGAMRACYGTIDACGWTTSHGWSDPTDPRPGDPCTIPSGTDCYPATVLVVQARRIIVARDTFEDQTFEPEPGGVSRPVRTWRPAGTLLYRRSGPNPLDVVAGHRSKHDITRHTWFRSGWPRRRAQSFTMGRRISHFDREL